MHCNHLYRNAVRAGISRGLLNAIFRHPIGVACRRHPVWMSIAGLVTGFLFLLQPVAIWALAILALFIMSVYRGEFQAALGSLVIGVFFPFIMAIAGLLAGVAPIILVIGLLVFFFKSANTPPPVEVSRDTYNKLKSIRR